MEDKVSVEDSLPFGVAFEMMRRSSDAYEIFRDGWNGKGMFVRIRQLGIVNSNEVIDNPCLLLYNVHGKFNTWVPSVTDLMSCDWHVRLTDYRGSIKRGEYR